MYVHVCIYVYPYTPQHVQVCLYAGR